MNTTAIQTFENIRPIESLLKNRDVMARFAEALGMEKAQPYIASVLMTVMKSRDLMQCEPESILFAALDAAQLRLSVAPQLGHAYIIPFARKATMIVGYKGMKFMAIRTGLYAALDSIPIFQGERVEVDRMGGWAEPTGDKATDLTKIIGRLAYFKMNDGYKKALYMTREEIHAHARQFSKGYNSPDSAWRKPWMVGAMEAKTPFRLLMEHDGYMDPFELAVSKREEESQIVVGSAVDVTPPPAPSPFSKSENGEGGIRTPEEVKAWLVGKVGELAMRNRVEATAAQRAKVMKALNDCFAPDPMADKKRADVGKWLTGYATLERMPGATVLALGLWLIRMNDGQAFLDPQTREEARLVWSSVGQVVG